jgi:hypothetical protein
MTIDWVLIVLLLAIFVCVAVVVHMIWPER